jgi:sec-independent protein translocase protein TatA
MFGRLSGWELIIILVILLLFFGARKLPDLARSIGESAKELREGFQEKPEEEDTSGEPLDAPPKRIDGQDPG